MLKLCWCVQSNTNDRVRQDNINLWWCCARRQKKDQKVTFQLLCFGFFPLMFSQTSSSWVWMPEMLRREILRQMTFFKHSQSREPRGGYSIGGSAKTNTQNGLNWFLVIFFRSSFPISLSHVFPRMERLHQCASVKNLRRDEITFVRMSDRSVIGISLEF